MERETVIDALGRYQLGLSLLGLSDAYLVADFRLGRLAWLLVTTSLRLVLIAPVAVIGALVNALPYWAVHWTGRFVRYPAIRASARLLAGVPLFPATWLLVAWLVPGEAWWVTLAVLVSAPVTGLIAVRALEQAIAVHRTWRGWIRLRERSGELERLRVERAKVAALVERVASRQG